MKRKRNVRKKRNSINQSRKLEKSKWECGREVVYEVRKGSIHMNVVGISISCDAPKEHQRTKRRRSTANLSKCQLLANSSSNNKNNNRKNNNEMT